MGHRHFGDKDIPANILTGAEHPAFSTDHLADTDRTNITTTKKKTTQNLNRTRQEIYNHNVCTKPG